MSTVDTQTQSEAHPMHPHQMASVDLKRKRSPSHEAMHPAPLPKAAKTSNHLQINYLVRQIDDDLPLITNDDTLPNILSLLGEYQGVLDRHESMACNLGARLLGPILIKRFERLFEGSPRVLKSHGKDGTTITWLDVVEFARSKPEQFQLGQMSEGVRVCQFYTKQCRVQISEEDFVLINSGIPFKMIPPQPIVEDEEKELGTIEILEKNLGQICQLADQVAARTRQLNHRLKGRKLAILDRRATASPTPPIRPSSPSNVALMNGGQAANPSISNHTQSAPSTSGGFVAVNARPHSGSNGNTGASLSTRHELLSNFHTVNDRRPQSQSSNGEGRKSEIGPQPSSHPSSPSGTSRPPSKSLPGPSNLSNLAATLQDLDSALHPATSPVPIPHTPLSLIPNLHPRSQQGERDDGGPFKSEMVHRMENLAKGERILPPCDRCRRLHMDCLKNLTACMGCTKKHAKCSWKEVREGELRGGAIAASTMPASGMASGISSENETDDVDRHSTGSPPVGSQYMSPSRQHQAPTVSHLAHAHSPPRGDIFREKDKAVAEQLQETAKSGLAAHGRMGESSKGSEYQTMVA